MDWLRRVGREPPSPEREPDEEVSEAVESAAPGVAAFFEGVREDRSHSVLDLGSAGASSLRVYSRFARQVRFVDLPGVASSPRGGSVTGLLEAIPSQPDHPYDLVFGWDVFDRLFAEYHVPLVARLAELTTVNARLHVVVHGSEEDTLRPLRFGLLDTGRMHYEPTGPAQLARARLLPAQVGQLLEPFHVLRGFTLKGDLREYVAVRRGA